jgi:hypothetical protein
MGIRFPLTASLRCFHADCDGHGHRSDGTGENSHSPTSGAARSGEARPTQLLSRMLFCSCRLSLLVTYHLRDGYRF